MIHLEYITSDVGIARFWDKTHDSCPFEGRVAYCASCTAEFHYTVAFVYGINRSSLIANPMALYREFFDILRSVGVCVVFYERHGKWKKKDIQNLT